MNTFKISIDFSEPTTFVFWFFGLMMVIQLLFILIIYGQIAFHQWKKQKTSTELPPVSVIISARNEAENLKKHLPAILNQDYPTFELIVINHLSEDETPSVLQDFKQKNNHLTIINIEKGEHRQIGKKIPLSIGIERAKHNYLLFTDADCQPMSKNWIRSMSSRFVDSTQMVLGYGPLAREKGFLNKMIRFDTAWIAMNYMAFAKIGLPYMGIGRNLSYKKELFEAIGGFQSHEKIASGDDDLFVQEAVTSNNHTINLDPNSFCVSPPVKTLKEWFRQKSRHYTTAPHYKVFKKMMLGIYPLSLILGLISFVSLLCTSSFYGVALYCFGFVLLVKWWILGCAFYKLKEPKYIPWIPFWDLFYGIWTPIMYYSLSNRKKEMW